VYNDGVVYKLNPSGGETVLHTFSSGAVTPYAGVILDSAGNLYGTANDVIYEVSAAGQYSVLHQFGPSPSNPQSGLARDAAGNLYGTTRTGGAANAGIVYKLSPAGAFQKLYAFPGGQASVGADYINAGLVLDPAGNLYGTTTYAGVGGMVYEVDAGGAEKTLYKFPAAPGGSRPFGAPVRDRAGNLYGTANFGGATDQGVLYRLDTTGHETALFNNSPGEFVSRDSAGNLYVTGGGATPGLGAIYKVAPNGQSTVLYNFTGGADGDGSDGVTVDSAGNLYGTGGGGTSPAGLVFKLAANGQFNILYTFTGGADGSDPNAGLSLDSGGNAYGTTYGGGTAGLGVVYEVTAAGLYKVLYTFTGEAGGGGQPIAAPVLDSAGNLYGTAGGGTANQGIVYKLSPAGHETVLYTFMGWADGGGPAAGVIRDTAGNLYGTTEGGGLGAGPTNVGGGYGVVYKVDPSGQETILYAFTNAADGGKPESGVVLDRAGNLYGTCPGGGSAGAGVVYEVTP